MATAASPEKLNRVFRIRGPAADYFRFEGREALLEGGTRCGKGGPLWETVWTPRGATTLGELRVGDEVLGGDGGATTVTHVHELGEQTIYRVEFSTGEEVFTTHDHLWDVFTRPNHKTQRIKRGLMTTAALKERLETTTRFDAWVPQAVAHFAPQECDPPMHSYVLGVILGDGGLTGSKVAFSTHPDDQAIVDRVDMLWPGGVATGRDGRQRTLLGAMPVMRMLGMVGKKSTEKWIPRAYMYASIAARMDLVRGLMDTDGTVDRGSGMPRFAVSSRRLAEDFLTVIQSLGGAGYIRTKATTHEDSHSVSFWFDNCTELFTLERKKALCRDRKKFKTRRLIRRIDALSAPEPARCITVAAEDGLYLTNGFIVTHNSFAFLIKAKHVADTYPGSRQLIVRQTRKSLNESILRDWREEVLWTGHPAVSSTASREHQDLYRWKNGSEVYFAGMENARDTTNPILSTKFDRIYWCQLEESPTPSDWELLATRLSSFKTPYHQLTGDVNPAAPSHWVNRRFAPEFVGDNRQRFQFRHYDNPLLYDGLYPDGAWTKEGAEYMAILESTLTGVRRDRFLLSKWVAAEGQILENWDPRIHLIDGKLESDSSYGWILHAPSVSDQPIRIAYFTAGVDFGWKPDPGCMTLWAYDSPRWHPGIRRFRVAEVMRLEWHIDQWAALAAEWTETYDVKAFSCDPHDPEHINDLNLRLGKASFRSAPKRAIKCPPIGGGHQRNKLKAASIDLMREGLMSATGHVRTYLLKDAFPLGVDEQLRRTTGISSTEQEIESWVYAVDNNGHPTTKPDDGSPDHGLDTWRYDETLNFARGFGTSFVAQDKPPRGSDDALLYEYREEQRKEQRKREERKKPWT